MSQAPERLRRAQAFVEEGHRLRAAGDLSGAENAYAQAAALAPQAAMPAHNIGQARQMRGDLQGAEAAFRQALALEPGRPVSRAALGAVLLGQGRYEEGFPLYDAWRETNERRGLAAPELPYPLWRGGDPAGKRILVWGEEGFGDQIMFARFARLLRERGAELTWIAPEPLGRLFEQSLGVRAVTGPAEFTTQDFDAWSPSSALPLAFLGELEPPPAAAYLAPPPPAVAQGVTVGVMTRGNPKHPNDAVRSMDDRAAAELMAIPGVASLAPEATGARDFYDTARIISGLDLVVSVDTAVAHLAGALGKPVWLLAFEPMADWRWGQTRTDSPWYPSARIWRQRTPGDWLDLAREVRAELAAGR
jgi:hypothetical protein